MKKLFPLIFLILSLLIFFYILFKSEVYWDGTRREYYKLYYIFSTLLILISIFLFFLNQKFYTYIKIILISSIFSVYLSEIYLTFSINGSLELYKKKKLYKKKTGNNYDTRSKIEFYNDLKKLNENASVVVSPKNFIEENNNLFPLSGISNSKTINCNENGYWSTYLSDRYGFNNPDDEWNKQDIEFIIVGDSYGHGACVNRPFDIASVIRKLSNKTVLNLSYSGNGPLLEFATLNEYMGKNAKNLLWLYYEGNDIKDLKQELKSDLLKSYIYNENFSQKLIFKQNIINDKLKYYIDKKNRNILDTNEFFNKHKLFKIIKLNQFRGFILSYLPSKFQLVTYKPDNNVKIPSEFKKILELTKKKLNKQNTEFHFIYLPQDFRYKNINYSNKNYLEIKKIVKNLNINFIDLNENLFNKEENPLKFFPFELYGHYNVEGYSRVGEFIYNNINN